MQERPYFLSFRGNLLTFDSEKKEFRYLGNSLSLTETEQKILLCLMQTPESYCDLSHFDKELFAHSGNPKSLLRAHISHINNKTFAIGGRKLIESQKNLGYKLSFSL